MRINEFWKERIIGLAIGAGLLWLLLFAPLHAQGIHSVSLTWGTPSDMAQGDSYLVSRSATSGTETSATPVATIAGNGTTLPALSYVDTSITAGTTYYYVVYHLRGSDGAISLPSNEFKAVVPANPPGVVPGLGGVVK
jgi:hypothetical protein